MLKQPFVFKMFKFVCRKSKKDVKGNRKKRKSIIQDTVECVRLLLEIHKGAFDSPVVRFR